MGIIKTLIEKFKLNDLMAIILIASFGMIILPNNWVIELGLKDFINKYKVYISLCLILSATYYVIILLKKILGLILRKVYSCKRVAIKYMKNNMSFNEMQLLIEKFYDENNNVFHSSALIEYWDGRKAPLESKYILYLASRMSQWDSFAYNLQPYAVKFLNENLSKGNIKIESNKITYKLK